MERLNNFKKYYIVCFICVAAVLFTGCGKRWWDNWDGSYVWVSDNPYIYMPLDHDGAIIEINGEKWEVNVGWGPEGRYIYFHEKWIRHTEDGEIWVAEVKLKKDKLYLKIIEDYYGDYQGQEFVLEQRPVKEE